MAKTRNPKVGVEMLVNIPDLPQQKTVLVTAPSAGAAAELPRYTGTSGKKGGVLLFKLFLT